MSAEYVYCRQGSIDWHHQRLGIVTASCIKDVMSKGRSKGTKGQARNTYMMKLLAERLTGDLPVNYNNDHMQRGHEDEPYARNAYHFHTGNDVAECGFIRNGDNGYSPDGLVGDDGIIEIKSKLGHLHLQVLIDGVVPKDHIHQIQGGLWISEREWCDFVCYSKKLPLFVKRVERDEKMISEIEEEVSLFNAELLELESKIRNSYY